MKSYRTRYERRKDQQNQNVSEEDDDLISEYAPSELSAVIAAENVEESSEEDDDTEEVSLFICCCVVCIALTFHQNGSLASDENEVNKLSEEQELQKRMDSQNITVQLLMKGDGENFPVEKKTFVVATISTTSFVQIIGDIVRVKYTCSLQDGKVRIGLTCNHVLLFLF